MTTLAVDLDTCATNGSATTQVVTDYNTFVRLEAEWNEAVSRAQVSHPFLLHEWFRTWWESFGAERRLHLVVVRNDERIVAIAPMMIEHAHIYGLPARRLDFIQNDHTPRVDCIITGPPSAAYAAIWNSLRASGDEWDLLQLSRLPDDSPTRAALTAFAQRDRCQTGTWRGDVSPYLALSGSWESYQATLSAKFRSNLRNRLSRLRALGEPRLEVLTNAGEIGCALGDALRLEASGWKSEASTSIACDPAVRRFYALLAERGSERGWLQLMFLTVGGLRIATAYGARFDGRLFLVKTGYDPDYAACAPFKILTWLAIQRAYADGLGEIDFLGDAEPWKLEWTHTSRPHDWLFVFANTVRARLLHSLKFQVVPELKRWRA